jgi:hypothetical protein
MDSDSLNLKIPKPILSLLGAVVNVVLASEFLAEQVRARFFDTMPGLVLFRSETDKTVCP